MVTKAQLARR